ncbi:unnamed protein product [Bemisia tabaci]|uniref:Uncharacterized protein n=1 Tax=Bemisia tabaci TaxID=7038 RepID=A0A9P0F2E9_BEMTA|nr:unnamed protein product [Bemisia tabaci]
MSSSSSHYPPARRPFLKFPPPPPFPPGTHTDYAYAYYEPGPSTSKHTFINCYGTEENIYEEIGATQLEQEVRYVHSKHLQLRVMRHGSINAPKLDASTGSLPGLPYCAINKDILLGLNGEKALSGMKTDGSAHTPFPDRLDFLRLE